MSNRAFINFREVIKQYLSVDDQIEVESTPSSGKVSIDDREFKYKFYLSGGIPLLDIEFSGCQPNPNYVLSNVGEEWTLHDGDPIDNKTSEELADHCVSILYDDEPFD
jgi:hypothetical protein